MSNSSRSISWQRSARATNDVERLEARVLLSHSWFVSVAGNDKSAGTFAAPFRTIQHAASLTQPGDTVYVRAGTYRETVTPPRSGTAAAPITFTAYNNEKVTINGADLLTGWSQYQGSIYTASQPWDLGAGNNQVFVQGQSMNEARWPNSTLDASHPAYATIASVKTSAPGAGWMFADTATLAIPSLPDNAAGGGWVGATIHIRCGQGWNFQTGTVLASSPGSLTIAFVHLTTYETPIAGNAFYLTGKFRGLDSSAEAYRDPASGKVYLWTPTSAAPSGLVVEAKRRTYGFELSNRAYINVKGLSLFATSIDTNAASNHLNLSNLNVQYVSQVGLNPVPWDGQHHNRPTGILLYGTSNTLANSTIAGSSGNGVSVAGSGNTVTGCIIHDVDTLAGNEAGIVVTGNTQNVSYNTIYNTGRDGILATFATASQIVHNVIHDAGLQTTDMGGIYTHGTNGKGTVIAYNTVSNITTHGKGFGDSGIYLDNGCFNFVVHDNTVTGVDVPLKLNPPSYGNSVYNNTLNGVVVASTPNPNSAPPAMPVTVTGPLASLTVLPTLGGFRAVGYAINGSGAVAGWSVEGTRSPGFLYSNGVLTNLGTLGGDYGIAYAINASGDIAGASYSTAGPRHAFLRKGAAMQDLGTLPNDATSMGMAVNATDQVAGVSYDRGGNGHAFLYSAGAMQSLGALGGHISQAFGINDSGDVVGSATVAGDKNAHAFRYAAGRMQDLGTLGGSSSYAMAINNSGAIVGQSLVAQDAAFHAFVYQNGRMVDLGVAGGFKNSAATAINSKGDIVGYLFNSDTAQTHAFLYRNGVMIDLNSLLPTSNAWRLTSANGINDKGQITGAASSGVWSRAFVLAVVGA